MRTVEGMAGFARIEALLGAPLADVDEDALQRLVDGAIREDTDLEFKGKLYGNSDSDRRDLAGDVAALANAGGGLIVLGIWQEVNRVDRECARLGLTTTDDTIG
jgi:hypothetical protein